MSDTLNHIKEMHDKANDLYAINKFKEAFDILEELFLNEHTDWLIKTAEEYEKEIKK